MVRKGRFENLRPVLALAFLEGHGLRVVATSVWADGVCRRLKARRPAESDLDNKLVLVDCLLELVYELALSPDDDVSSKPA